MRKKVEIDAQAVEGAQVAVHDRCGDHFAGFCGVSMPLFDFFKGLIANCEPRFVFSEPLSDAGIKIPAEVVKFRCGGQRFYFGERFFLEMEEAEDHVSNLHTGIVDVILDFDAAAGVAQQTRESVAQDCVANVADMRGFVRIDAGVLDDSFWGVRDGRGGFVPGFFACAAKKLGAVEKEIQVASASHFDARDSLDRLQRIRDLLGQGARRLSHLLGEFEAQRRGCFAHGELRRALENDGDIDLVALVNVVLQRFADAIFDRLIHEHPLARRDRRRSGKRAKKSKGKL